MNSSARVLYSLFAASVVGWMIFDQVRNGGMTRGKWLLVPLMLAVTVGPIWL